MPSKDLLIYKSSYGGTKTIVDELKTDLPGDVEVLTLEEVLEEQLRGAERIAVGGAIHAGSLQRGLKQYLEDYREVLQEKRLALFISCMQPENAEEYFLREFPHQLIGRAELRLCIGGEVDPARLNLFMRFKLKRTTGSSASRQWRNEKAMRQLIAFFSETRGE
jgi:menaquinone-dependent protoporphyrinogen oxidase